MARALKDGERKVGRTCHYVTAGVKEVLTVHVGAASGGTWELTVNEESVTVDWNESAATLETLVESLSVVVAATVSGTGQAGTPWVITIDDPIVNLRTRGDGSGLTPSDTLSFVETTPGRKPGQVRPAVITTLGASNLVDLRVGRHGETYSGIDLMSLRTDTNVWYAGSRRRYD